ncbi:MAG: response regulator [Clostridia bacterium]
MKKYNILIADDTIIITEMLKAFFMQKDYVNTVSTVFNGESLLENLMSKDFDIIITDIDMPILTGIEAIEKYTIFNPQNNKMFIIMSGDMYKIEIQEKIRTLKNIIGTLSKPVNTDTIEQYILDNIETDTQPSNQTEIILPQKIGIFKKMLNLIKAKLLHH